MFDLSLLKVVVEINVVRVVLIRSLYLDIFLIIDNFFDAAEEVGCDSTPDGAMHDPLQNMDPVQRARQEEEWRNELAKVSEVTISYTYSKRLYYRSSLRIHCSGILCYVMR